MRRWILYLSNYRYNICGGIKFGAATVFVPSAAAFHGFPPSRNDVLFVETCNRQNRHGINIHSLRIVQEWSHTTNAGATRAGASLTSWQIECSTRARNGTHKQQTAKHKALAYQCAHDIVSVAWAANKAPVITRAGRPDLRQVFMHAEKVAVGRNESNVAVLVCGNATLIDACLREEKIQSSSELKFDCHDEKYGFA